MRRNNTETKSTVISEDPKSGRPATGGNMLSGPAMTGTTAPPSSSATRPLSHQTSSFGGSRTMASFQVTGSLSLSKAAAASDVVKPPLSVGAVGPPHSGHPPPRRVPVSEGSIPAASSSANSPKRRQYVPPPDPSLTAYGTAGPPVAEMLVSGEAAEVEP